MSEAVIEPPAAPPEPPSVEPPTDGGPYSRILNPETGEFSEGWLDQMPETWDGFRGSMTSVKSLDGLAKRFVDTQKAFHEKTDGMVKVPLDGASEEEIAAWNTARGVPESVDGYEIPAREQLPEGVQFNPAELPRLREKALELGFSNDQVNGIIDYQIALTGENVALQAKANEEWLKGQDDLLHETWGGEYTANKTLAAKGAGTWGVAPDSPLMQNAEFLQFAANAAKSVSESTLKGGEEVVGTLSARHQIKDIRNNPQNPNHKAFNNSLDPRHGEVMKLMDALYQQDIKENPPERLEQG